MGGRTGLLVLGALVLGGPLEAHAQTVGTTAAIAALVGPYATSQQSIGLYATDLGYSVSYNGQLRVIFGDSVQDGYGTPIAIPGGWPPGFEADDTQGSISLTTFPTGDSVDAWVAAHPGTPAWHSTGPTLTMRLNGSKVAPIQVYAGNSTALYMGVGRTPIAAFANKATGGGVFSFFARQVAKLCTSGTSCGTGFSCDQGMGTCNADGSEDAVPCVIGTARCFCAKPTGYVGVCQDQTSSPYADTNTEDGRILSVVLRNRVGNADQSHGWDEVYWTQEFATNKFNNLATRTVRNFDPNRPVASTDNVFSPGTGASGGSEKVFLWGRPNYMGYGSRNASAKLYFAYANMPSYSGTGSFSFTVNYFTGFGSTAGCTTGGLTGTYPCFSTNPGLARALNLGTAGSDNTAEPLDIVTQHSVSWVPAIGKFVMLYGGDMPPSFLEYLAGPNYGSLAHDADGAIYFRYAAKPWGPWSQPVKALKAGPRHPPISGLQYASNGALYDPYCSGTCVAMDPSQLFSSEDEQVGRLYGANIVDEWTMTRGTNTADIYWFVSTWDPYQVIVAKTRINP